MPFVMLSWMTLLNTGSFAGEIKRAIAQVKATRLIVTEPGEYRILQKMKALAKFI
jgi:deoxyribodipyrimidine photolyase-related protein